MQYIVKTCLFQHNKGKLKDFDFSENLNKLGFKCKVIKDDLNELFNYIAVNRVDLVIADSVGLDVEAFESVISSIRTNLCNQVIVLTDNDDYKFIGAKEQINFNVKNFELNFNMAIIRSKTHILSIPRNNLGMVKARVMDYLLKLKFISSQSGFYYFAEAVAQAYFDYPFVSPMMQIYENVSKQNNKSVSAIEKAMRDSLSGAIRKTYKLPKTEEFELNHMLLNTETTNARLILSLLNLLLKEYDFIKDSVVVNQ